MAPSKKIACMTCDVERFASDKRGMSKLLKIVRLFDNLKTPCTFFFRVLEDPEGSLGSSEALQNFELHEFALHIHWGWGLSYKKGLHYFQDSVALRKELHQGMDSAMKLGYKPISIRSGGLCQNTLTLTMLNEMGFKVDSSVAAKLDEREGWFQGHENVPYRSWYFPKYDAYDVPSNSRKEALGILELPVTRCIPSARAWFPFTLDPTTFLFKFILAEWEWKPKSEEPLVVVPVFHSWGDGKFASRFDSFLERLRCMIRYMEGRNFEFLTMSQAYDLIQSCYP